MDETQSELTKVSALPKRPYRLPIDESFQMTSRTLDKSFTEISDVTDLSVSKVQKASIKHININNDSDLDDEKENFENKMDIVKSNDDDKNIEVDVISIIHKTNTVSVEEDDITNLQTVFQQKNLLENSKDDTEYLSKADTHEMMTFIRESLTAKHDLSVIDQEDDKYSLIVIDEASTVFGDEQDEETNISILPKDVDELDENLIPSLKNEEEIDKILELKNEDRRKLLKTVKTAILDRNELLEENQTFQSKLVEYLRRKRPDAARKMKQKLQNEESTIVDREERYEKYLLTVTDLQTTTVLVLAEMKEASAEKMATIYQLEKVIGESVGEFSKFRHDIASRAMHSNTGRRIPSQELENLYSQEKNKDAIVEGVRLENIKLQNTVNRLQTSLFAKETLTNQLNLVDFEQYKIENQAFNAKLEERIDSISRLKIKIHCHVHMISHTKEKIQNTLKESDHEKAKQKEVTVKFNSSRKKITRLKRARDDILTLNKKLSKSGGLLGYRDLLDHFKRTVDEIEVRKERFGKMNIEYNSILKQDNNNNRRKNSKQLNAII